MMLLSSRTAPASRRPKPFVSVRAVLLIAPKLMQVRRCFSLSERALAKQLKPEIQGCLINKCTMPAGNGNGGRNKLCGKSSISMPFFQAPAGPVCNRSVPDLFPRDRRKQHTLAHCYLCFLELHIIISQWTFFMESIIFFTLEYYSSGGAQKTYQGVTYWVVV